MKKRKLQIGVVGSMSDLDISEKAKKFCDELGKKIADSNAVLVFGSEKDCSSLPTIAAMSAKKSGGLTLGVTYDKGLSTYSDAACVTVATGLVRGGGREMVQALSCDGLIAVSGGSGTLNEITVAYQAGIPVVCVDGFGGWSEELAGRYLDGRKRYKFGIAKSPVEALNKIEAMIQLKEKYDKD